MVSNLKGPILIVGVSGFIGASLFEHLRKSRDDVYGISRKPQQRGLEKWDHLISVDITNYEHLRHVLYELKPRTIFNLSTYGGTSAQTDSTQIYNINYMGANNLLRIMKEIGYDAFVQAGSQSEYGLNCKAPREDANLVPNSDYAVAKIGVSYLIKYYGSTLGFPCTHLRLYSIYGPLEDKNRLIPKVVEFGKLGKYPPFASPIISHDFVYIDDCIDALIKSAFDVKLIQGIPVNISTGVKTTLLDVGLIAKKIFGITYEPEFGTMENRKWDVTDWYGDSSFASWTIGWKAKIGLEEGIRRMI